MEIEKNTIDESYVGNSEDYIIQAEKAADVVSAGLKEGNYTDMCRTLESMSEEKVSEEKYIFKSPGIMLQVITVIICVAMCIFFLVGVFVGFGVMIYSESYYVYGLAGVGVSVAVIFINIALVLWSIHIMRFYRRYKQYNNVMGFHSIELVDDIATFSGQSSDMVERDLAKAVKQNLIPQGHFGKDNIIFITNDNTYNKYLEKQAVYDRYYRKQKEERMRMKERSNNITQVMDSGQRYLDRIRESNAIIKDKEITHKLDVMENIVAMIFHEVDIHENQINELGLFLNYYLPTTEKLLDAYIDVISNAEKSKSLQKMQMEIEKTLDALNVTFEGILHSFYREQEMDILSDISALEIMMKQES